MFSAGAKVYVERCSTGHSLTLSQPEMLTERLIEAFQGALSEQENETQHELS